MNLERIYELEDKEFTSKLFKNAFFKGGGGSGGGGTNTQTVEKADPWEGQQPFLKDVFQKAQNRYNTDSPQFYPDNTVVDFNPLETSYQNQLTDYIQSGRPQAMQTGAESAITNELFNPMANPLYQASRAITPFSLANASALTNQQALDTTNASPIMQQMLSGSVQQNPFISNAVSGFADDAVANFQNKVMPALRSSQIAAGQYGGGTRGEISSGLAAGTVGRSIADFANQSYMDAFNRAMDQQMGAANLMEQGRARRAGEALGQYQQGLSGEQMIQQGLGAGLGSYGDVAQTMPDFLGNLSDVGLARRELDQQRLDEAVNRFQFDQNIQDQKLANYANLIQGNYGSNQVSSAQRGGTGLAGNLASGLGAVAGLAGLLGA